MPDRRLLRQTIRIPMGGPLSPAMCNGTCAWMEREWRAGLSSASSIYFEGCRYMDDILLAISRARNFDSERFLSDFKKSECYWEPMHLKDAGSGIFLETVFSINTDRTVRCRLNNVNENEMRVWRYHHYRSQLDYTTKRAILMSIRSGKSMQWLATLNNSH